MTALTMTTHLALPADEDLPDEAELAAAAFLARYQGRTLDAYRHDLRAFFQWAAGARLEGFRVTSGGIDNRRYLADVNKRRTRWQA